MLVRNPVGFESDPGGARSVVSNHWRMPVLNLLTMMATGGFALAMPTPCELRGNELPPQRLELYTSEGCSSCPPADRWLAQLPASASRLTLAFHVDYWDDLGWKDRYSDPRFSARQHGVSARGGSRTSYTPEVVVDGREYRGWRSGLPAPQTASAPALVVTMDVHPPRQLQLQWSALDRYPAAHSAYAAVTEDALESEIRAGENRGVRLRHDAVVRAYAHDQVQAPSLAMALQLPQDLDRAQAKILVWLEDADGRTVQGLSAPLNVCGVPAAVASVH